MKKIYIILIGLCISLASCEIDKPGDFYTPNPSSGWLQISTSPQNANIILDGSTSTLEIVVTAGTRTSPFVNLEGLQVGYSLVPVSGAAPSEVVSTGSVLNIPAGENVGTIVLNINNNAAVTQTSVFDVVIASSSNEDLTVGLSDNSVPTRFRVTVCPTNVPLEYTGVSGVLDFEYVGDPYDVTLTQVDGDENSFLLANAWGPTIIADLTGNPGFLNQFPYNCTLTIDPETYGVTVMGNVGYATGGDGTYDPCTQTFELNLTQALFTVAFDVQVTLVGK